MRELVGALFKELRPALQQTALTLMTSLLGRMLRASAKREEISKSEAGGSAS